MIVYRICKGKYENDLSGQGARLAGGRWNSKGVPVVYTSQTRALCMVEVAVHIPFGYLPVDYKILSIEIPDSVDIQEIPTHDLPNGWNSITYSSATQAIGDDFIKTNKFLVLKVPSATVDGEFNYLINPNHANIRDIKIVESKDFRFDIRLFK